MPVHIPRYKVTRDTRAGHNGKIITCPNCDVGTRVYHFSWSSLKCAHCKEFVDKYKWLVGDPNA